MWQNLYLGGVVEGVDCAGVGEVVVQVLDRALQAQKRKQNFNPAKQQTDVQETRNETIPTSVEQRNRNQTLAHLAGDDSLHVEAEHGEHSEAAVLQLLHLQESSGRNTKFNDKQLQFVG